MAPDNLKESTMNEIPFYTPANLTRDPELRSTENGQSVAG
jgi:single-stranded DNA-binding protein